MILEKSTQSMNKSIERGEINLHKRRRYIDFRGKLINFEGKKFLQNCNTEKESLNEILKAENYWYRKKLFQYWDK